MSQQVGEHHASQSPDTNSPWKAEMLRFTAFLPQGAASDPAEWWGKIVGEAPEERIQKPREGTLQEAGSFLSGRLVLAVEPLRVDWVLSSDLQTILHTGSFNDLPGYGEGLPEFLALAERWIILGVPVVRLALSAVLLMPAKDRQEGYRMLSPYLPSLRIDPVGSSDLLYQINRRRRSSTIDGLQINRLTKWSVGMFKSARFQLDPIPSVGPLVQTVGEPLSACRLEIDINTSPENSTPFHQDNVAPLLDELAQLASEISTQGDCP